MKNNPMVLLGAFEASTLSEESRTVDVIAYAGAPVQSWDGEYTLSLDEGAVDFTRMKTGAGVFLDHNHSIESQIGVIEGAELVTGKHLKMSIRFGKDEQAERYYQGVKDGIFQNLSIGAFVLRKKDVTGDAATRKSFMATRWQPFEVSLVGVPADPQAKFLSQTEAPECEVESAEPEVQGSAPEQTTEGGTAMADSTDKQGQTPAPEEVRAAAIEAERERSSRIMTLGTRHKIAPEVIAKAVADGVTFDAFQAQVLDILAAETERTEVREQHTGSTEASIESEIGTKAQALASERNITREQATVALFAENPKLYERYLTEHPAQVKKEGR